MFDRLPPIVRHIILMLIAAEATWLIETVPKEHLPLNLAALIGVAATALLAYITPLTAQYGVGAAPKPSFVNIGTAQPMSNPATLAGSPADTATSTN